MGALGLKYHNLNGIRDLKSFYLGPWTLRAVVGFPQAPACN